MNASLSSASTETLIAAANGLSVLVCLVAAIMVLGLKLYKIVTYRLALYQVLAGLAFASVGTLKILVINYDTNPEVYSRVCSTIAWLTLYCQWAKLLFTAWLTFHLFCFGVLHKNLNKLELLYVVTSLLIPAIIAAVPQITDTYGLSPLGGCYIYVQNDSHHAAFIERFALWDGPAMAALLVASVAMFVMLITLARIVCRRSQYEPVMEGDQFWKALRQLLPLAAFPILFFILIIPVLVVHIQLAKSPALGKPLTLTASVFFILWSMTSGIVLITHILVVKYLSRRSKLKLLRTSHTRTGERTSSHYT